MANKLKNMSLSSVDLVRRGANQKANILLKKSAPEDDDDVINRFANWLSGQKPQKTVNKSDADRFDTIVEVFP